MTLRLFTNAYPESDPKRRKELDQCLQKNAQSGVFASIHLFLENLPSPPIQHPIVETRPVFSRPRYSDYFAWINEVVGSDDLCFVANTDIYFDESIQLLDSLVEGMRCAALSRWEPGEGGRYQVRERGDSQDTWVFRGPIRESLRGDFPVGVRFCDNKIAWEIKEAGYEVSNPSLSIRSYHLHQSSLRSYDSTQPPEHGIRPPYLYLEPDNIGSLFHCFRLWRKFRPSYFPWRLTRRKLKRSFPFRLLLRSRDRVCQAFSQ